MYRRVGSDLLKNRSLVNKVLSPRWKTASASLSGDKTFAPGTVYEGFECNRQVELKICLETEIF